MTGRAVVELDVRFRVDELEPVEDGTSSYTPVVATTIAEMPLVIVRDLLTIDELALGHAVAMLLTDAASR